MAMIKNWVKVDSPEGWDLKYRNYKTNHLIVIVKAKSKWFVNLMLPSKLTPNRGITLEHFKTKSQALTYARAYMKAHPRG